MSSSLCSLYGYWLTLLSGVGMVANTACQLREISAVKSMDAVCYAEHLHEIEWHVAYLKNQNGAELSDALRRQHSEYEKSTKQQKSERAKELNRCRHAKTTHAKEVVTVEWGKNPSQFSSAEKAGNYYADWLEQQGILPFDRAKNCYRLDSSPCKGNRSEVQIVGLRRRRRGVRRTSLSQEF